jgi:hypothetical protein
MGLVLSRPAQALTASTHPPRRQRRLGDQPYSYSRISAAALQYSLQRAGVNPTQPHTTCDLDRGNSTGLSALPTRKDDWAEIDPSQL